MIAYSTLRTILDKLRDVWDEGPPDEGWQSDALKAAIIELERETAPLTGSRLICQCQECKELRAWYLT